MSYAYTTSGSIKKYESNQWSIYWKGNTGTCTGPDASTGEYTITAPDGMSITSTKNDTSYCLTIYAGITNWFYFESKTITINFRIQIHMGTSKISGTVVINWITNNIINQILDIVKPTVSGTVGAVLNRKDYPAIASFNETITSSKNGTTLTSFYSGDIGSEISTPNRIHYLDDLAVNGKSNISGTAAGYNYTITV